MKNPRFRSRLSVTAGMLAATLLLAACGDDDPMPAPGEDVSVDTPPPTPPGSVEVPPPAATSDMQAVLDALAALGPQPIETLTPDVARQQPSFADAYKTVLQQRGIPATTDAVTTEDRPYGSDPLQFVRIYRPAAAEGPLPVVVYYHGGGWVIANVDTYDATPRYLAEALNAIVISVEYRKAPEFKFPAQHRDASLAYAWTLNNAASLGGDLDRLALVGESAGGNLAVATAILARDENLPEPDHVVAIYPIANTSMDLPSRTDSANAKPLNTAALSWFAYYYQNYAENAEDPRINLVEADLEDLPTTTIINAQIDPLRSDGETLAAAMQAAGVDVEQRTFAGVTHEFFGLGKVVPTALEAEQYAVARIQASFDE